MKKIFSLLLSFNLVIIPVTGFGADEGDQFRTQQTGSSGGDFYAKQILMIANAGVGTTLLLTCPLGLKSPSIPVYAAASMIYVAGELFGAKAQGDFHKKSASDMVMIEEKMKNGGEVQKASLEQALNNERKNLEFIKQRKLWAIGASVAYTAATGLAVAEIADLFGYFIVPGCEPLKAGALSLTVQTGLVAAFAGATAIGSGNMFGGMASLGAALGGAFYLASMETVLLNSAPTRAGVFGASAALSYVVVAGLSEKEKVAEKNVAMLEKALAQFNSETQSSNALNTENDPVKLEQERKKFAIQELAKAQQKRSCWVSDGKAMNFSSPNCTNAMKITKPTFPPNFNVPTLASAAANGVDMANAIASGDTARADILAGQLASQAARVKEIKEDLLKKVNEDLKAKGKPGIDLDKEVNKNLAKNMSDFNRNLASKGIDLNSSSSGVAKLQDLDKKDNSTVAPTETDVKTTSSSSQSTPSGYTESSSSMATSDDQSAKLAQAMNTEYEIQQNDISKESQASIFQQLSNRYILNYTKFFNETKKPSLEKK